MLAEQPYLKQMLNARLISCHVRPWARSRATWAYIQRFRGPKRDSCAHQPDRIQVMRAWVGRLFGKRVAPTLRLALLSYLNNPVILLVSLALIIATSFLKCIVWGCDLGMQSGWVFVGEFIAPGLAAGFLASFVWHWWRSGN